MDLKTFAENDFDPKKWINKAWSTSGNQEKEVFVANTVSRLQLYMKQLTNSLDETTTQIVTSVPRILQDASALQLEGALLQEKLQALESKVQGVEEETGHSIQSLQRIDQLKSRLENAASALREADKWAALATSLEDILESGVPTQPDKLKELADQVAAMTASLEVLSDAPDYENKQLQLETLYNRLEAAISPPLIDALTQMDADRASRYVTLYHGMGRGGAAGRCWRRAAAARLAAGWRRAHTHTLPELTRVLASEAERQVDWLTNVLKSDQPLAELIRLYTDLLLSLEPSPTKIVSANLKLCSSPEEGINLLTDLKRDIDEFIACITTVIKAPRPNKEELPTPILKELGLAVYSPLRELLDNYTELQSQLLLAKLKENLVQQDDLLEQSRSFLAVAEKCNKWLTSAYNSAKKIGGDAIYPYYAPAVETFLTALASQISAHSRRIESVFLSTTNSGRVAGVLSNTFPATLALQAAVVTLLENTGPSTELCEETTTSPLHNLPDLLLEPEVLKQLTVKRAEPPASLGTLRRASEHLRGLAKAILRHPVDTQLEKIPSLPVWSNNDALSTDLPDFAISPQEYITEIGQYLMTLPQHLEMHLSEKQAPLQFLSDIGQYLMTLPQHLEMHLSEKQAPLQFLSDVCTHTCEVYAEKILNIRNMDALGTKRCLTDIVYLSSVVEDLGTSITPALRNLEKSLRQATPQTAE